MRTFWRVRAGAVYACAAGRSGRPVRIDVLPEQDTDGCPPTMIAIDVEPDSMCPQQIPHIVLVACRIPAVLACISRGTNIANWGAAVYCAWVVRDSLVVGDTKPMLRKSCGKSLLSLSS